MTERNPGFEPGSGPNEASVERTETSNGQRPASAEEMAFLECFFNDHPEAAAKKETRRDCEAEKGELRRLINEFGENHSLEKLNAVTDVSPDLFDLLAHYKRMTAEEIGSASAKLTPEDAEKFRTRVPAKDDLVPIAALLNTLENETNISSPDLAELRTAYKILSQAVGMINNNKVDHTR